MTISIAIATRDRPEALGRCLDALAAGDLQPDQVVVVDQSAGEETRRAVEARAGRLPLLYVRQAPLGLSAAQNLGFARAEHPLVAVTDDDCRPHPQWLAVVARSFEDPGLDGLAGRVLPLPAEGKRSYPVASRASPARRDFRGRGMPWAVGSGNNFALRRDWYERVGGCDERLGPGSPARGGVDMDLFYRLLRAGARLRYEPAALVFHERQTRAGRLARRPMYGRGMGTACALWLREGDAYAARVLAAWVALRGRALARALARRRWDAIQEEALVLGGTAGGLAHGLLLRGPARPRGALDRSQGL